MSTDLFVEWVTDHFLKHKASGKVILLSDGHRVHCNSSLLLQIADENNVAIIRLPRHYTHTLQPLDKWFFGPWKCYFKIEAAAFKIARHRTARLNEFACSKDAFVGVGVSAFGSTGIYTFNSQRLPEYLFSISDTSEPTGWSESLCAPDD